MAAQGRGTQRMRLGMDTSQHGRGEADPGAQARGAQVFLLPSRGRLDGHRREPWFKRPGSESRSGAVLCLASDSASLSPPLAPLQIFAIHDLLHSWGEFLVLSAPLPNPVAGAMLPLHDLEAAKTTPAQTFFAKKLEAASATLGSPGAPRPKRQQSL